MPATWSQWTNTFADLTDDLSTLPTTACPACGAHTLKVAFYGPPNWDAASGFFWCDTCLHGVSACRMTVPAGAEVIPLGTPPEDWPIAMPDFTLVQPTEADFED